MSNAIQMTAVLRISHQVIVITIHSLRLAPLTFYQVSFEHAESKCRGTEDNQRCGQRLWGGDRTLRWFCESWCKEVSTSRLSNSVKCRNVSFVAFAQIK